MEDAVNLTMGDTVMRWAHATKEPQSGGGSTIVAIGGHSPEVTRFAISRLASDTMLTR
jgi:hypothetical protein